jgi:hypothetical protein
MSNQTKSKFLLMLVLPITLVTFQFVKAIKERLISLTIGDIAQSSMIVG